MTLLLVYLLYSYRIKAFNLCKTLSHLIFFKVFVKEGFRYFENRFQMYYEVIIFSRRNNFLIIQSKIFSNFLAKILSN
jgi:hypothetical protein